MWCGEACRKRHERGQAVVALLDHGEEDGLVAAVRRLVDDACDPDDAAEVAQGELAFVLAAQTAAGSPTAAAQLRQVLADLRAVADPGYDPPVTAAQHLRWLCEFIGTPSDTYDDPLPPGYRSTVDDGDVLVWLGSRRVELVETGDAEGVDELDRWCGAHAGELAHVRRGRCPGPFCSAPGLHPGYWPNDPKMQAHVPPCVCHPAANLGAADVGV